jgi:hypothetical protein
MSSIAPRASQHKGDPLGSFNMRESYIIFLRQP